MNLKQKIEKEIIFFDNKKIINFNNINENNEYNILKINHIEDVNIKSFNDKYDFFKEKIKLSDNNDFSSILIDKMDDVYEAKIAILAAKENSELPVMCTVCFDDNMKTLTGTDIMTAVLILEGLNIDALGVSFLNNNIKDIDDIINRIEPFLQYSSKPVAVEFNKKNIFNMYNNKLEECFNKLIGKGVSIFGFSDIDDNITKKMITLVKNRNIARKDYKKVTCACSSLKTVIFEDTPIIIGEKINPTGKEDFKQELIDGKIDYILNESVNQQKSGADILDINVGLPEINEKQMMVKSVQELQKIISLPLQIDSADAEVIEAAVRMCNGKPIINSVNGSKESMERIFPIAKKYGACVVGLTFDENGIPADCNERFKVAEKIISTAENYGIDKRDIIIDCLVMTCAFQQEQVFETLNALKMVKEKLGVKTILGISNVSYGLPNRELLNNTFLVSALTNGLDSAIVNPMQELIMNTIRSFKVMKNIDKYAQEYIKYYKNK